MSQALKTGARKQELLIPKRKMVMNEKVNGCGGVNGISLCYIKLTFLLERRWRSSGIAGGDNAKEGKVRGVGRERNEEKK